MSLLDKVYKLEPIAKPVNPTLTQTERARQFQENLEEERRSREVHDKAVAKIKEFQPEVGTVLGSVNPMFRTLFDKIIEVAT
jgi:hypothetical protein